ncbi:unnamed protein product [Gongylonema pulchrum]|uniref:Protein-tyrosine-phosphatase n=1 Tax=Gongylonema pulchrum TaxID=637853 RepID=A0A183DNA0_9BILA|nr:unnamed protein product [Gongylonema pulchrum]
MLFLPASKRIGKQRTQEWADMLLEKDGGGEPERERNVDSTGMLSKQFDNCGVTVITTEEPRLCGESDVIIVF